MSANKRICSTIFLTFSVFLFSCNWKRLGWALNLACDRHNTVSAKFMHARGIHSTTWPAPVADSSCLETRTNRTRFCVCNCVCVVPRQHENYSGALERIHTYEFFIGLEFEIFYTREKPTQPKKWQQTVSWASNDLESMMLFLSISVYLA